MTALVAREHLKAALLLHVGQHHGINARDLASDLGITTRHLRLLISALREEGLPVCGTPETGYFLAANAAELEQCCAFLRSRAMHSLVIEARLRKLPLPTLLGQMKLSMEN